MKPNALLQSIFIGVVSLGISTLATAEETANAVSRSLSIDVNRAQTTQSGCLISLFIQNGLHQDVEKLVLETVLMTSSGQVDRLTLFDLGRLPSGRPRVRQFELAGTDCENLGMLIVNGVTQCSAGNLTTSDCEDALELSSKSTLEVVG